MSKTENAGPRRQLFSGDKNRVEVPGVNATGGLEQELLDIMWARSEPATVNEIHRAYFAKHKFVAYTTIMTTMTRLWEKGILSREPSPTSAGFLYGAAKTREQVQEEQARKVAHAAFSHDPEAVLDELYSTDPAAFEEFLRRRRRETSDV